MARRASTGDADRILTTEDASLLDVVDNALNKGVVLNGDLTISLAHVDLIYARLSLLLCAADRVLPRDDTASPTGAAPRTTSSAAARPPARAPRSTVSARRPARRARSGGRG